MAFGDELENKKKGKRTETFGGGGNAAALQSLQQQVDALGGASGSFATQQDVADAEAAAAAALAASEAAQAAVDAAQDAIAAAEEATDTAQEATTDTEQAAQDTAISANTANIAALDTALATEIAATDAEQVAQDAAILALQNELSDAQFDVNAVVSNSPMTDLDLETALVKNRGFVMGHARQVTTLTHSGGDYITIVDGVSTTVSPGTTPTVLPIGTIFTVAKGPTSAGTPIVSWNTMTAGDAWELDPQDTTAFNGDWDTVFNTGWYAGNGATSNFPPNFNQFERVRVSDLDINGAQIVIQEAFDGGSGRLAHRRYHGPTSAWSDWRVLGGVHTVNGLMNAIPSLRNPAAGGDPAASYVGCFVAQDSGPLSIPFSADPLTVGTVALVVTSTEPATFGDYTSTELSDIRTSAEYTGGNVSERQAVGETSSVVNLTVQEDTKYYIIAFAGGGTTTPATNITANMPTVVPEANVGVVGSDTRFDVNSALNFSFPSVLSAFIADVKEDGGYVEAIARASFSMNNSTDTYSTVIDGVLTSGIIGNTLIPAGTQYLVAKGPAPAEEPVLVFNTSTSGIERDVRYHVTTVPGASSVGTVAQADGAITNGPDGLSPAPEIHDNDLVTDAGILANGSPQPGNVTTIAVDNSNTTNYTMYGFRIIATNDLLYDGVITWENRESLGSAIETGTVDATLFPDSVNPPGAVDVFFANPMVFSGVERGIELNFALGSGGDDGSGINPYEIQFIDSVTTTVGSSTATRLTVDADGTYYDITDNPVSLPGTPVIVEDLISPVAGEQWVETSPWNFELQTASSTPESEIVDWEAGIVVDDTLLVIANRVSDGAVTAYRLQTANSPHTTGAVFDAAEEALYDEVGPANDVLDGFDDRIVAASGATVLINNGGTMSVRRDSTPAGTYASIQERGTGAGKLVLREGLLAEPSEIHLESSGFQTFLRPAETLLEDYSIMLPEVGPSVDDSLLVSDSTGQLSYQEAPVFGQFFQRVEAEAAQTSVTANTFESAATLSSTALAAGTYRIGVNYLWSHNIGSTDFRARVMVDGVRQGAEHRQEPKDVQGTGDGGTDQKHLASKVVYITVADGDTPVIDLQYTGSDANIAMIGDIVIELWRVS